MDREAHISDQMIQHIARISHGKDSMKMLDVIFTRGLPLDRITTTDIWATDTIRGEHPKMVAFKERADEYIWRKYHIEVEHLCAMKDGQKVTYEKLFYHVPKRKVKNCGGGGLQTGGNPGIPGSMASVVPVRPQTSSESGRKVSLHKSGVGARSSKSTISGFPVSINRRGNWCTKLKIRAFSPGPDTRGGKNIVTVEYLGIAADEPKRFGQLNDRKRAPLVEFGIEEGLCGLFCQYEGILAPTYETGCRDGCWMCHNQGVNQLRLLRRDYPDLWALLLKWDVDSPVTFRPGRRLKDGTCEPGHTVHDFDRRFQLEDDGLLIPGDTRFRWSMLDEDLQYRMF